MTTLLVPHDGTSAAAARRAMTSDLEQHDVPAEVVDDALLVLSELVGNAVRHGSPLPGGDVRVSWWVAGGAVHLEVCDGGPGLGDPGTARLGARLRDPDAEVLTVPHPAEGGRGLPLVDLLSTRWGTTAPAANGAVGVYAEIPLGTGPTAVLSRGGRTGLPLPAGSWAQRTTPGVPAMIDLRTAAELDSSSASA